MNVFIVDDEIVIRESLRACSLWDGQGFTLVGEASDGELALSMIQDVKPDILITDIRMPFMDGLELSRQVKAFIPWIHIVILSGYDDFSYARQAIALGVTDYLLKPVDEVELLPTLRKIKEQIERERRVEQSMTTLKEQERQSLPLRREKLLQALLEGSDPSAAARAQEEARALRMDLSARFYLAVLIMPQYTENRLNEHAQAVAVLRKNAAASGGTVMLAELSGWPVALVLGDRQEDLDERGYGFAQTAQFELMHICRLKALICIGSAAEGLGKVGESLQVAWRIAHSLAGGYRAAVARGCIVGVNDTLPEQPIHLTDFSADTSFDEQLGYVALGDVKALLDSHLRAMGPTALQSRVMGNYVYMQLLMAVTRLIQSRGGDVKAVLPAHLTEEQALASLTEEELYQRLLELLTEAVAYRDRQSDTHYSTATRKAIRYILANYMNLGINMREVARHVALSASHFCTVFAQDAGMTFTEYLTHVRMENAKNLLTTTDMLSQDIAASIGYNDRHYFSYLFKKNTGYTPLEYRKLFGK